LLFGRLLVLGGAEGHATRQLAQHQPVLGGAHLELGGPEREGHRAEGDGLGLGGLDQRGRRLTGLRETQQQLKHKVDNFKEGKKERRGKLYISTC